jgi:hypothetical protein
MLKLIDREQTMKFLNRPKIERTTWPILISICLLVLAFLHFRDWIGTRYDDAYITFRYAQQFSEGNGFRFNPADNANSASPLLFGALLAINGLFGIVSIPIFADFLNLLGLFAAVYGITVWSFNAKDSFLFGKTKNLFALSFLASGYVGYWLFSGMETIFCIGLAVLALGQIRKHFLEFGVSKSWLNWKLISWMYLLGIARSELLFVSVAIGIWLTFGSFFSGRKTRVQFSIKICAWKASPIVGPLIAAITQVVIYRFYYGNLVADPIRFKRIVNYYIADPESQWLLLKHFIESKFIYLGIFAMIALVFQLIRTRAIPELFGSTIPFVSLGCLLFLLLISPNSDFYRYQILLLPFLALSAVTAIPEPKKKSISLILSFALLAATYQTVKIGFNDYRVMRATAIADFPIQRAREYAGRFLEESTQPNSIVWSGDLGAISFYNPSNQYFDGGGLTNRSVIQAVENGDDYSTVLCEFQPDFIADSIDVATDTPSVVWILDNLSSYFSPEKSQPYTSRTSKDLFTLSNIWRNSGNGTVGVGVYEIDWIGC